MKYRSLKQYNQQTVHRMTNKQYNFYILPEQESLVVIILQGASGSSFLLKHCCQRAIEKVGEESLIGLQNSRILQKKYAL